jgi:hypothetical protein
VTGRQVRLTVGAGLGGLAAGLALGLLAAERAVHTFLAWRWAR